MIALTILLLLTAVILGGGTTAGFIGDVYVQIFSLFTVAIAIATLPRRVVTHAVEIVHTRSGAVAVGLLISLVGLHLIQLVPLPQSWTATGPLGSEGTIGLISRVPYATGAALASLIPPLAIFVLTATSSLDDRSKLITALMAIGVSSLLFGLVQVAQGPASALRFFEFTNRADAVGFFANRNHFAALLCILLALGSSWLMRAVTRILEGEPYSGRIAIETAAAVALLIAILTGLMMARSRAGILLAVILIVCITIAQWLNGNRGPSATTTKPSLKWLVAGFFVAGAIAVQLGLSRALTRFGTDPLDDLRWTMAKTSLAAARDGLPFGTGISSFVQVYGTVERTENLFGGFANRAHNDWLEFSIEGGLLAIVLMAVFLGWFISRTILAPKDSDERHAQHISGVFIILLLLLHSFVDYPLRTTALSTIFAFGCALLLPPLARPPHEDQNTKTSQSQDLNEKALKQHTGKWSPASKDRDWPDAWQ